MRLSLQKQKSVPAEFAILSERPLTLMRADRRAQTRCAPAFSLEDGPEPARLFVPDMWRTHGDRLIGRRLAKRREDLIRKGGVAIIRTSVEIAGRGQALMERRKTNSPHGSARMEDRSRAIGLFAVVA